jgi:hypothetical protein
MPTDQTHVIAFFIALAGMASLGIGLFVYVWLTIPKRKPLAVQQSFDFAPKVQESAAAKPPSPPMARV